jgi:hypothetical protein
MKNNKTRKHIKQHKGKSKTTTSKNTKIKSKRMKKRMKKTRKRVYSRKDYNSGVIRFIRRNNRKNNIVISS